MVDLPTFFQIWADKIGWTVPSLHYEILAWLQSDWHENKQGHRVNGVLKVFRGAAKSTIVGIYIPWKLYQYSHQPDHPGYRFIVLSENRDVAMKMVADAQNVIVNHPLTQHLVPPLSSSRFASKGKHKWQSDRFSIKTHSDVRNPSVIAHGVRSTITSSRADEFIFDDPEVPKNVHSPELREKLKVRLRESTHVLFPWGRKLFIGTPHTHDDTYTREIKAGANHFVRTLVDENVDQIVEENYLDWPDNADKVPLEKIVSAWPEYFNPASVMYKRVECGTRNEWLSQYMLTPLPTHDIRLNPDRLLKYEGEVEIVQASFNRVRLTLKRSEEDPGVMLTTCSAYWDVSLGKARSDDSVIAVVFQDEKGREYIHRMFATAGPLDAQCQQLREYIIKYQLPNICVETTGVGGFVPQTLRKHIANLNCGIRPVNPRMDKTKRIHEALETRLAGRRLYAHVSVMNSKLIDQMRDWHPGQGSHFTDDYLDAVSGAILQNPVNVGTLTGGLMPGKVSDWIPYKENVPYKMDIDPFEHQYEVFK